MTYRRVVLAALMSVVALFATALAPAAAQELPPTPRVTVAVIDSGPNPYHEFFATESSSVTPDVLAEFGIDESHIIRLTRTGDFEADFARDRAQFDAIRDGEPYWFEGTNIIGISFGLDDGERLRPDGDASAHGVGTNAAVLTANPEAIVVAVEASSFDITRFGSYPVEEAWAFNHPAIDIVSTSYGPPGSPPLGYSLVETYDGVVTNGKLHVGASDNSPALAPFDATAGPWWSIGIAGYAEGSGEARTATSGTYPDFVADFTQELPYCRSCETGTRSVSGTSFATPGTAGTLSKVLLEARRVAGHSGGIVTDGTPAMVRAGDVDITNWEVRRALEEGAFYPSTALPVAPAATFSWGAVTPDPAKGVVTETLAHLGFGEPSRSKDATTCQIMTANIEARQAYWNSHPRSEGFGTSADPYINC